MKKTRVEKGITLIALIITIIILLILAVVTIGSIKNSNIITYAQNASNDYEQEKEKEESLLSDYEDKIKEYLNGKPAITWKDNGDGTFTSSTGTTVEIGDYVEYKEEISTHIPDVTKGVGTKIISGNVMERIGTGSRYNNNTRFNLESIRSKRKRSIRINKLI